MRNINPLKAQLNPICHLLALLGTHHILHVSSIRVNFFCNVQAEEISYVHKKIRREDKHVIATKL
jgi:hypothetical protein